MNINPIYLTDFYKTGHVHQYPEGTSLIFSNLTPRKALMPGMLSSVWFGLRYFIKRYLRTDFNVQFFAEMNGRLWAAEYDEFLATTIGRSTYPTHIEKLHNLGHLPIAIYALPELTVVPCGVPAMVMFNTHPDFAWVVGMLETLLCCTLWPLCTSATIAREFRLLLDQYAVETSDIPEFVDYQGHDFSFRGMFGAEAAAMSGMAHLQYFKGTDTIPALLYNQEYYGKPLHLASVPASEHSVMCVYGEEHEYEAFKQLINNVYPSGVVSIVSDSWNLWRVLGEYLPRLAGDIMARNGRVVIRPDSGDPVEILCGTDKNYTFAHGLNAYKDMGVIECLWDIFGGTINSKGYKQLDPHIGVIYGDGITIQRARAICARLKAKGFASTNVVFGIGSFCVRSDTPILCSDLIWRRADSLQPGEEILAFDENPEFGQGSHAARRYKKAIIEWNKPAEKLCITIKTDIGDPITASEDHPWLVWSQNRNRFNTHFNQKGKLSDPKAPGLIWKKTSELQIGDKIAYLGRPWELEQTCEAGWLAGLFDGEGSISPCIGDARIPAWKISIAQNRGWVLDRIISELEYRNFSFYEQDRGNVQLILTGGFYELLRFLGTIWPNRLMIKFMDKVMSDLPSLSRTRTYHLTTVTELEAVGIQTVASIKTSSGTFITNGYLSHNTYQYNTRDSLGWAMKTTYAEVHGIGRDVYKDPITDDGTKRSARGLLKVMKSAMTCVGNGDITKPEGKTLYLKQQCTWDEFYAEDNQLKLVYKDGQYV